MSWIAFDIGGANLKVADGNGYAASQHFPLWKDRAMLPEALRTMIAEAPSADHLIATMTGELADCYRTKAEGVADILSALDKAADGLYARVYLVNGKMVTPTVALRQPHAAAASNWHALACFAGRFAPRGAALLIDIGSTTTDIIPLVDGKPATIGVTDTERLISGELVYTGVERTPVCAISSAFLVEGAQCPVAQEYFSTTRDAYLLLGDLPEFESDKNTADSRPATRKYAHERLARQVCADGETFSLEDANNAAEIIQRAQLAKLGIAASNVLGRLPAVMETVILSGRGEFLARRLVEKMRQKATIVSLSEELGPAVSRCATAHALAVLAREAE